MHWLYVPCKTPVRSSRRKVRPRQRERSEGCEERDGGWARKRKDVPACTCTAITGVMNLKKKTEDWRLKMKKKKKRRTLIIIPGQQKREREREREREGTEAVKSFLYLVASGETKIVIFQPLDCTNRAAKVSWRDKWPAVWEFLLWLTRRERRKKQRSRAFRPDPRVQCVYGCERCRCQSGYETSALARVNHRVQVRLLVSMYWTISRYVESLFAFTRELYP